MSHDAGRELLHGDCTLCSGPLNKPCGECGTPQVSARAVKKIVVHNHGARLKFQSKRETLELCGACGTAFLKWTRTRHNDDCVCFSCRIDRDRAKREAS